jgi:putative transposase
MHSHSSFMTRFGRRSATIMPGRGVNTRSIYYWNDLFALPKWERQKPFLKENPFDAGSIYAYLDKKWVQCLSQYHSVFKDMSTREIQIISMIIRQQRKHSSEDFKIDAKMIAEFYLKNADKEEILLQHRKDEELRRSLTVIEGGKNQNTDVTPQVADPQKPPEEKFRGLMSKDFKPCKVV